MVDTIVGLDPGHGGPHNPGGGTRGGIVEKDYCLEMGRRVKTLLNMRPEIEIVMSRDEDINPSHEDRIKALSGCELVLSLHINSQVLPAARPLYGFRAQYWPSNDIARQVGDEMNARLPHSLKYSRPCWPVKRNWKDYGPTIKVDGEWIRNPDFCGWKHYPGKICAGHHGTTILLEMGFITSDPDYEELLSMGGRTYVASAIIHGIDKYRYLQGKCTQQNSGGYDEQP